MYFLNAESYDDDIEIISTSDVELESSSVYCLSVFIIGVGRVRRLWSGSIIFAIENFNGPFCCGIKDCAGGDGENDDEYMLDEITELFADSIIGLFDVNGTPIGLDGCMPLDICELKEKKNSLKFRISICRNA